MLLMMSSSTLQDNECKECPNLFHTLLIWMHFLQTHAFWILQLLQYTWVGVLHLHFVVNVATCLQPSLKVVWVNESALTCPQNAIEIKYERANNAPDNEKYPFFAFHLGHFSQRGHISFFSPRCHIFKHECDQCPLRTATGDSCSHCVCEREKQQNISETAI